MYLDRTGQAVWYWHQSYADYHDEEFTAEPGRVAVDEKQVQLAEGEEVWLYAASYPSGGDPDRPN